MCHFVIDKNQRTSDFDTVCGLQHPLAFIIENIMPGVYLLKYDIDQTSEQRKTLPNVMEDEGQVEVDGLPLISR